MSLQPISDRKRRRAIRETGLPIARLVRVSNNCWEARAEWTGGHTHVSIDPRTWEYERSLVPCWTSCETTRLDGDQLPAWYGGSTWPVPPPPVQELPPTGHPRRRPIRLPQAWTPWRG